MRPLCTTVFWDPAESWNVDYPVFSPCFRSTVLVAVPLLFIIISLPLDIVLTYKKRFHTIPWNNLNITKLALLSSVLSLELLAFVSALVRSDDIAHILAPLLKVATISVVAFLIVGHRLYGVRSSGVLFCFWVVTFLTLSVELYSQILDFNSSNTSTLSFVVFIYEYAVTIIQLILSFLADKKPVTVTEYDPEDCSFIQFITFSWFSKVASLGYQKPLELKDLFQISNSYKGEVIYPHFNRNWQKQKLTVQGAEVKYKDGSAEVQKTAIVSVTRLFPVLVKTFGKVFLLGVTLKIIYDAISFANPFLLDLLIKFADNKEPVWHGYIYAVSLFLCNQVNTFLLAYYFHLMFNIGVRIKSALSIAVYRKSLSIDNEARNQFTTGEIVNLMAVDAMRFQDLIAILHILWSGPIRIAIALALLWGLIGPSSMAGLLVMLLVLPLTGFIFSKSKSIQGQQMKNKDTRVKEMNEILNGMKVLKLYGWEPSFNKRINSIRETEVTHLKRFMYLNAVTTFVLIMAPYLVALSSFATYILSSPENILTPEKAFVSLSLFNIIRFPLMMIPVVIVLLSQTAVSMRRIQKFLNAEELDITVVQELEKTDNISIAVHKASFAWEKNHDPILKNIDFNVPSGSLVAIVGSVGCGKSSLIQALLGEMRLLQGEVKMKTSVVYAPQQAWIKQDTVRNNILFHERYIHRRYRKVIDACALQPDLDSFGAGEMTEIGSKGINISGGQKQRISLARAVYTDADVYLMDDPLSAVDAHVGKHLFDKVIGPTGFLSDKTRVLVTNAVHILPQCDKIIVLESGEIIEMGTFKELITKDGPFQTFLKEHILETPDDQSQEILSEMENIGDDEVNEIVKKIKTERSESVISDTASIKSSEIDAKNKIKENSKMLVEDERIETGTVKLSVVLLYMKSVGVVASVAFLLCNVFGQIFSLWSNFWLSEWSEDPPPINGTVDTAQRDLRLGVYGGLGIAQGVFAVSGSFVLTYGVVRGARYLHRELLFHILRAPMAFFDTTPIGRILNRFSKDLDVLDMNVPSNVRMGIQLLVTMVGVVVVISLITPIFLAFTVPLGIIYFLVQRYYIASSRQIKRLENVSRSPIYSHFTETLNGRSVILAANKQSKFCLESEEKIDDNTRCFYTMNVANRWLAIRLETIGNLIILAAAILAVLSRDSLVAGKVGLSLNFALSVTQVLNFLVRTACDIEGNIVAVERIKEYMEIPQEAPWEIPEKKPSPTWPDKGEVIFDDYKTRYREGLDLVLKGITCHINPSEKVGIVGRTGAGKSSFTVALFRIIEGSSGKIFIDGVSIDEIGLHDLRSKMTIIPQDPILFSGTLRFNLDPFEVYSDEELWKAMEQAHLKSFVQSLDKGLDSIVAEGGNNISVGQRQLICLARALLRNSKILILDEATAAMDLETDELIQTTIREEFSKCTVLTVAHRIKTVIDADKIMVMDDGFIAEFDTPTKLLEDKSSMFYSLASEAGAVN